MSAKLPKHYFIAGGASLEAVRTWNQARKNHYNYMRGLADKLGSEDMYSDEDCIQLFSVPPSGMPKGWRKGPKKGTMIPSSGKAGAPNRALMDAAPKVKYRTLLAVECGLTPEIMVTETGSVFADLGI